ncbi:MAG TPA: 2-oxoacid:ferredoxin oxidoreductase subunit beta, partial [Flavihumibacter sp.]|nr:2-oxoacid:ferredoxin oxidoreductase subunit beta [Flavihumibacter sp.]
DCWVHDDRDFFKAQILVRLFDDQLKQDYFPRPFGVFFEADRPCYEDSLRLQIEEAQALKGMGDLDKILRGHEVFEIV